jgi:hypothetical protein
LWRPEFQHVEKLSIASRILERQTTMDGVQGNAVHFSGRIDRVSSGRMVFVPITFWMEAKNQRAQVISRSSCG